MDTMDSISAVLASSGCIMAPSRRASQVTSSPSTSPLSPLSPQSPQSPSKTPVRSPMEELKHLYFARKYRQCITKSHQLVTSKKQNVSEMANTSQFRIPTFEQAEHHYSAAMSALPTPMVTTVPRRRVQFRIPGDDESEHEPELGPPPSPMDDAAVSRSPTPGSRRGSWDSDSRPSSASTNSSAPSLTGVERETSSKHSPVFDYDDEDDADSLRRSGDTTDSAAERFNAHLKSFELMLQSYITAVRKIRIASALTMGASTSMGAALLSTPSSMKAASRFPVNIGPDGARREMSAEEKRERIARGRERGWIRPRFEAERYQAVCARALNEL